MQSQDLALQRYLEPPHRPLNIVRNGGASSSLFFSGATNPNSNSNNNTSNATTTASAFSSAQSSRQSSRAGSPAPPLGLTDRFLINNNINRDGSLLSPSVPTSRGVSPSPSSPVSTPTPIPILAFSPVAPSTVTTTPTDESSPGDDDDNNDDAVHQRTMTIIPPHYRTLKPFKPKSVLAMTSSKPLSKKQKKNKSVDSANNNNNNNDSNNIPPYHDKNFRQLKFFTTIFQKPEFWAEVLILERIYYKNKSQHRQAGFFKNLQQCRRLCQRLQQVELSKIMNFDLIYNFQSGKSTIFGGGGGGGGGTSSSSKKGSPSVSGASSPLPHHQQQQLQQSSSSLQLWDSVPYRPIMAFVMQKIVGCTMILKKLRQVLYSTYSSFYQLMSKTQFMSLGLIMIGLTSRLSIFAKSWMYELVDCYGLLKSWIGDMPLYNLDQEMKTKMIKSAISSSNIRGDSSSSSTTTTTSIQDTQKSITGRKRAAPTEGVEEQVENSSDHKNGDHTNWLMADYENGLPESLDFVLQDTPPEIPTLLLSDTRTVTNQSKPQQLHLQQQTKTVGSTSTVAQGQGKEQKAVNDPSSRNLNNGSIAELDDDFDLGEVIPRSLD